MPRPGPGASGSGSARQLEADPATERPNPSTPIVAEAGHVLSPQELAEIRDRGYLMVWFDDVSKARYYDTVNPTLGAPDKPFFVIPAEDGSIIVTPYDAARYTGMSPATHRAAYETPLLTGHAGDVYSIVFPGGGIPLRLPTVADAGGWEHFLPGGHTAVRLADGGGYLVNPTREFVIPGGTPIPDGSLLLRLGEEGQLIVVRSFGG